MTLVPPSPDRALRIALVAHADVGGSGTVATDLATGLAQRGHQVHMIAPRRPFRLAQSSGVFVHEFTAASNPMWESPPWGLALAARIARICRDFSPDVMHAHFAIPYAVAVDLAVHLLGPSAPPWVLTLHGSDVEALSASEDYAPLIHHVAHRASALTVPSQYLYRQLALRGLLPQQGAQVIPNFVDSQCFCPDPARAPPSSGAVLVHASSFRPVKRTDDVVTIFANVAASTPARLLLLGDGPDRAAALARLRALGLEARVTAPGAQPNIHEWLRQAHVALLPSERESFGLAALEALASGVPVIGSDVGGLPDLVVPDVGTLAPLGNTDEMTAATLRLLKDDATWSRAALAARHHALNFDPARALSSYESIYHSLVAASADPSRNPPLAPPPYQ